MSFKVIKQIQSQLWQYFVIHVTLKYGEEFLKKHLQAQSMQLRS